MATSTPSKTSGAISCTTTSSPRTCSTLPAERAEAIRRISPQTSARVESNSNMTVPTAPVVPTRARVGFWGLLGMYLPSCSAVDHGFAVCGVQAKGMTDYQHGLIWLISSGQQRNTEFGGGHH